MRLKTSTRSLLLIVLAALVLRLALLIGVVHFPGIADPNHYYNLGVRLIEGHGLTLDYIWQYNDLYPTVVHPDDHWMPLTGIIAAAGMTVFGEGTFGAVLPFALLGSLLPLITYAAARQLGVSNAGALWSAAAAALLPEFVLNSVRTDTTIPNALMIGLAVIAFTEGMRRAKVRYFVVSGVATGIAYAIRSESAVVIPAIAASVIGYAVLDRRAVPLRQAVIGVITAGVCALMLALPWVLRNLSINGTLSTPTMNNMFFLTSHNDHYLFNTRLSLETMLAAMTPAQLIGRRLFELAATAKLVITTLDVLIVPVLGGAFLLLVTRDRARMRVMLPAVILLIGFVIFYPLLVPFKSQGGSMKKALLSLLPLYLPFAAFAFERAITDARIRAGAWLIALAIIGVNGVELVRQDDLRNTTYLNLVETLHAAAIELPDQTGEG